MCHLVCVCVCVQMGNCVCKLVSPSQKILPLSALLSPKMPKNSDSSFKGVNGFTDLTDAESWCRSPAIENTQGY